MDFKKRLLIIIGIPLGICIVLIGVIIFIGFDIGKRAEDASNKKVVFLSRLAVADSLASLKEDSEKISGYFAILENILPKRDRLVLFPKNISAIGAQNNLNTNITLGQGGIVGDKGFWQTSFKINGDGTLDNFVKFIKILENSQYLINIESFDFGKESNNFKALISGKVFSM